METVGIARDGSEPGEMERAILAGADRAGTASTLRIRLLGGFELRRDGDPLPPLESARAELASRQDAAGAQGAPAPAGQAPADGATTTGEQP